MHPYFSGQQLYGDDFDAAGIEAWFRDEQEGYADLGARDADAYSYGYHALNDRHAFRFIRGQRFKALLGFGSAYGDELRPLALASEVDAVTIVDPSAAFVRSDVFGTPATYVKPAADGCLPLTDAAFDLATCFGVLHHIPNVSSVLRELARVIEPGGHLLSCNPIISMATGGSCDPI